MLVDPSGAVAVSTLGRVDRGALWVYSSRARASRSIRLGEARYLRLYPGKGDRFAVSHHSEGEWCEVSVHAFSDPGCPLATVRYGRGGFDIRGEVSEFDAVPDHYVVYFNAELDGRGGYYVLTAGDNPCVRRIDWFDDGRFDHGYQSVTSVNSLGSVGSVFTVQRSSELVVCDPETLAVKRTVLLPTNRYGNPSLRLVAGEVSVLVADDYDAVVTLDPADLSPRAVWEGQPPIGGSRMFIGSLGPACDPHALLVPRPG